MEFTGERLVPGIEGHDDLFLEHVSRYMFASALAEGKKVLDAGCGCGYGSYHLARAGASSVLGIDTSDEAIEYCRHHWRHEGLSFLAADVTDTGLDPGSFDVIVGFEVFEHLAEPERFLVEMHRLLARDGLFVLSTPNAATYVAGGEDGKNPFHVREYTPEEFSGHLERHFAQTLFYVQSPRSALSIVPVCRQTSAASSIAETRLVLPPSESDWGEPVPAIATPERGAYLIALCYRERREMRSRPGHRLYTMGRDLGAVAEERLKTLERLQTLEKELDRRARWAQDLQGEVEVRDRTIERLQEEFEERTQWALELDRTVEEQRKQIVDLQGTMGSAARAAPHVDVTTNTEN